MSIDTVHSKSFELLSALAESVYSVSLEGICTFINGAALELLGYREEEVLGKDPHQLFHHSREDARGYEHSPIIKTMQDGKIRVREEIFHKKNGSVIPVLLSISPVTSNKVINAVVVSFHDISIQKEAERKTNELINKITKIGSHLHGAIFQFQELATGERRFPYASEKIKSIYGFTPEEISNDADIILERIHPDDLEHVLESLTESKRNLSEWFGQYRVQLPQKGEIWIEGFSSPERLKDGSTLWHGYLQEITDRKIAENEKQLAASVFTYAREGIVITDEKGYIVEVNSAFTRITGYKRYEALGLKPSFLKSGQHQKDFYEKMWNSLLNFGEWSGEIWNRRKTGEIYAEQLTISAVYNKEGEITHFVGLFSDITVQKEYQKELERIAHFDALTGLPNRVLFSDRLYRAMASAERKKQLLAVAYIDLDGFKQVNDQYGHATGDQVLVQVANRMRKTLREGDSIARLGGDEFTAVFIDVQDQDFSLKLARRLQKTIFFPMNIDGNYIKISCSIGLTFYPQVNEVDADQLLRQSDQAMYLAKVSGKNDVIVFDAEHDRSLRSLHENAEAIRKGLRDNEFVLYYQPKVSLRTGKLFGAEALVRWNHPRRGFLTPDKFLAEVEFNPVIIEIGEWVLKEVLAQQVDWQNGGFHLRISVNIGVLHLEQSDFFHRVKNIFEEFPEVSPSMIEFEILETSALKDISHVSKVIDQCRTLGIEFALDNFGTGYSSLTYLKRIKVSTIKLDQSFVRNMPEDSADIMILDGILSLAKSFGKTPVAEGVESEFHSQILLFLGCEIAQGYGIASPILPQALLEFEKAYVAPESLKEVRKINKQSLKILMALVEFRAWVRRVEYYIHETINTIPELRGDFCKFGKWLKTSAPASMPPELINQLEVLHEEAHEMAFWIFDLKKSVGNVEAYESLPKLYVIRDKVINIIFRFLISNCTET